MRKATAPSAALAGPAPHDVDVHLASTSPTKAGVSARSGLTQILGFCRQVVRRAYPPYAALRSRYTTENGGVPGSGPVAFSLLRAGVALIGHAREDSRSSRLDRACGKRP